jgi:hypothetical protein
MRTCRAPRARLGHVQCGDLIVHHVQQSYLSFRTCSILWVHSKNLYSPRNYETPSARTSNPVIGDRFAELITREHAPRKR